VRDSYYQDIQKKENEISLYDIFDFLTDAWKRLAIATIVGGILGFTSWYFLGSYQAESVLQNHSNSNTNTNTNTNTNGLDLLSWMIIQKNLPNLAAQIVVSGKAPEGQAELYSVLADNQWWQKNAVPIFAISRVDMKDFVNISKGFDGPSADILNITLSASGSSKEGAVNAVRGASQFLRSGGAYLQIRSFINGYEREIISAQGEIQKKITGTKIEMGYQKLRSKSLEELYKRYPSNSSIGQQVIDPKESGAKYLSITTQIIAANNDINQSRETLNRLEDRLAQIATIRTFLNEALPKLENNFDGLVLGNELLAVEVNLREKIDKDDHKQLEILDEIRSKLLNIQACFNKSLESNAAPTANKKGMIKATAGGLAGGFFLMLLVLLSGRVFSGMKSVGDK
jgi:hypothetical protein